MRYIYAFEQTKELLFEIFNRFVSISYKKKRHKTIYKNTSDTW